MKTLLDISAEPFAGLLMPLILIPFQIMLLCVDIQMFPTMVGVASPAYPWIVVAPVGNPVPVGIVLLFSASLYVPARTLSVSPPLMQFTPPLIVSFGLLTL